MGNGMRAYATANLKALISVQGVVSLRGYARTLRTEGTANQGPVLSMTSNNATHMKAQRSRTCMHTPTADIESVAKALRTGQLAIFPTDTIYGIGCVATDASAVKNLVRVRGRDTGKPLIILLASEQDLHLVAKEIAPSVRHLMRQFWPGPLTIILPAIDSLPEEVTAGTGTVAVRVPGNALTRELILAVGAPLVAPSANHPGQQPAQSAVEARETFPDITLLDGGPADTGVPSTIIALRPLRIIREGRIPRKDIENAMR